MLISANFVPSNFEILNFYNEEMCFAWSGEKLVIFPYIKSLATAKLVTIRAPRNIRSLRCFDGRVFVLCDPVGVYKILRSHKFSPLSSTAYANGPLFYEVFVPDNDWLVSQDKSTKVDRRLFQLEPITGALYRLCDLSLNTKNSTPTLRNSLQAGEEEGDQNICVVANNTRLFKIGCNETQLIHRSDHEIIDILAIFEGELIAGFALVSSNSAILAYVAKGRLVFDKVHLDGDVRGLCAGLCDEAADAIWLAHIDGTRIHYWMKSIKEDTFCKTKVEYKRYTAIRNYKNKRLICLTDTGQLLDFDIEPLGLKKFEHEEFIGLRPEMLRGVERIVDAICDRAKELQNWNEKLLEEQEKLKRINIYSHKQKIVYLPEIRVERTAGRLFVLIKFDAVLPLNCHVIAGLVYGGRHNYCVKYIEDSETLLGLSLNDESFDDRTGIQVDLVTLAEEGKAWCLIRNYTKNPKPDADLQIISDRSKFINAKLAALRNLSNEGGLNIQKLSAMKKSIRRELKNL